MMRGLILHLNSAGFVQFARVTGASNMKVLFGHLVPNAAGRMLRARHDRHGQRRPHDLGALLPRPRRTAAHARVGLHARGREERDELYPGQMFVPGLAILLVVAALNFLGDALRDAFDVRRTE